MILEKKNVHGISILFWKTYLPVFLIFLFSDLEFSRVTSQRVQYFSAFSSARPILWSGPEIIVFYECK